MISTTVGETAADFLNVNIGLGITSTAAVTGIILCLVLYLQIKARSYIPWHYWFTVVLISIFSTLITDILTDRWAIPLLLSTKIINQKLLKPHHVIKTRLYFQRYGAATILIGRFIPVVRTVAPFLAGLSDMRTKIFLIYNLAGAFAWCGIFLTLGYCLGGIAWVQNHMTLILILIIAVSLLPVIFQLLRKTELERT